MNSNKSLAILICYFGKLPWYFNYFIHSCKYNPTVDFFIITDSPCHQALPKNIIFLRKNLEEISVLATDKLKMPIRITYGYKLCDFKPAYGCIFSDLLIKYDWWGHADLDVLFGNIRNFMTDEILDMYDLISVRPDWLPGCFLLFKNTPKMNTLFTHSKDYKKVFSSNQHYCFDETNFAHDEFTDGKSYLEIDTEIESMMHVVKKLEANNYLKPYFDLHIIEGVPGKLRWEKGRLFYRNRYEVLLYHFIRFKKKFILKNKNFGQIPDVFTITPTKIHHKKNSKQFECVLSFTSN